MFQKIKFRFSTVFINLLFKGEKTSDLKLFFFSFKQNKTFKVLYALRYKYEKLSYKLF